MDPESTGLLTILCQHVFHCTCLLKWRGYGYSNNRPGGGAGCPVCRFTQDSSSLTKRGGYQTQGGLHDDDNAGAPLNECGICRSDVNLWICLICGNVGCGRYDAAHAFMHYKSTSHAFAMDLSNQRVWDYACDGYVHRIMQDKSDGKLVELPAARDDYDNSYGDGNGNGNGEGGGGRNGGGEYVPREKLDAIGLEYTHLLTSQLDSQRLYFEEKLDAAADKASRASATAGRAADASATALARLEALQVQHDTLAKETLPALERERDRAVARAGRFEEMSRRLEKQWREESTVSESLMTRIGHLEGELGRLREEKGELEEQNRDLAFFVSGSRRLQEMEMGEEVVEGKVSLPEAEEREKGGKGRKKKKRGKKGMEKGDGEGENEGPIKDKSDAGGGGSTQEGGSTGKGKGKESAADERTGV
ncbi:MAG: hypothetical protein LQ340_008004 [Diploschistes diacapsis]|nr:MAG: hypothetical protein LQ340_008004 [Diploschistes diacapsis]